MLFQIKPVHPMRDIKIIHLNLLFLFIMCLALNISQAQVNIALVQPPPGQLNIEDLWKIQVNNFSDSDIQVYMNARVDESEQGLLFDMNSSVFTIQAGYAGLINISDIAPLNFIQKNELYFDIIERTGSAPSGNYTICLTLLDPEFETELVTNCIEHTVEPPSAPQLISPFNEDSIEEPLPMFIWEPPMPINMTSEISYSLKIIEILADQSSDLAVVANPIWWEEQNISVNNLQYPISARLLEYNKNYAWQVTAYIDGISIISSEIWTFTNLFDPFQDDITGEILEINLISPDDGAFVSPDNLIFCWEDLGIDGVTYEVFYTNTECDPDKAGVGHPYPYLLPNPRARHLDSLITAHKRDSLYWKDVCEKLKQNIDVASKNEVTYNTQKSQMEEWAKSVGCILPDHKCESINPCCPGGDCCDGIDPSSPEGQAEFARRIRCLSGSMNSLNRQMNELNREFARLMKRWHESSGHRATMGAYADIFGFFEDVFSGEWLENLSQEIFEALGFDEIFNKIADALKSGICESLGMTTEECNSCIAKLNEAKEFLENAQEVKDNVELAAETFKNLKSGGAVPYAVFTKLMQALYSAAGEAAQSGVRGWEEFQREMCNCLQQTYMLNACLMQLNKQMKSLENCTDLCKDIQQARNENIAKARTELARIRLKRHEDWLKDEAIFKNKCDKAVEELANSSEIMDECCKNGQGNLEFSFPPYDLDSDCEKKIFSIFSKHLGNLICYYNIDISIKCTESTEGGLVKRSIEIDYKYEQTDGFRRIPGCCPVVERVDSLGRAEGNGEGGEICLPGSEEERERVKRKTGERPNGKWGVEGKINGKPIASSPRRKIVTLPRVRPPADTIKTPVTADKCQCKVQLNINNAGVPPGLRLILLREVPVSISMTGSCTGPCSGTKQTITIARPLIGSIGFKLPQLPLTVNGNNTNYDFPEPGKYLITAKQYCSDGTSCIDQVMIDVPGTPGGRGKPKIPEFVIPDLSTFDQCGNDNCIKPYYDFRGDLVMIKNNILDLGSPQKATIGFQSTCMPECNKDRDVIWLITEPDGNKLTKSFINIFELDYDFNKKGMYYICVTEIAECGTVKEGRSKYILVYTESDKLPDK